MSENSHRRGQNC